MTVVENAVSGAAPESPISIQLGFDLVTESDTYTHTHTLAMVVVIMGNWEFLYMTLSMMGC